MNIYGYTHISILVPLISATLCLLLFAMYSHMSTLSTLGKLRESAFTNASAVVPAIFFALVDYFS
jgi:hypothetical protein